jgi:Zn-dependent protease/predicted transcriptional regulator
MMFGGGGSIRLGRVFGIPIGVDWSWFIALFLIISLRSDDYADVVPGSNAFVLAVISALLLFLSILLHELGHAVVALRNGVPILGIELMIFGGVARLGKDTESPGVEFRVAIAGPVVTLVIALVAFGLGAAFEGGTDGMMDSLFLDRTQSAEAAVLGDLALVNVALLLFNLIPAFPLDGGRIARAIAWKISGDRNKATRFAAVLGRLGGWAMIAGGAAIFVAGAQFSGIWLAVIGFFLAGAARSAQVQAAFAGRIEHIRVADVMDAEPVAVSADSSLADAEHTFFLRYGWPWFPVVDSNGRLVGVVSREAVESVPLSERDTRTVASVMARDDGSSGLRVRVDEPLESLLGQEGLARLGAIMAVDGEGVLRGVVTVDAVRRALRGTAPAV